MISFIIANGRSRNCFDLNTLQGRGVIYGCNALYRDYVPDFLVAIDEGIINEIKKSNFPKEKFIVPPYEECWEPIECNPNRPRSNAGMNAMREAIKRGSTSIIGLGFDFLLCDAKQSVSNLYDGTSNYGPETRASHHDNGGRINYLEWLVNNNPNIKFIFLYPKESELYSIKSNNVEYLSYDNFTKNISNLNIDN